LLCVLLCLLRVCSLCSAYLLVGSVNVCCIVVFVTLSHERNSGRQHRTITLLFPCKSKRIAVKRGLFSSQPLGMCTFKSHFKNAVDFLVCLHFTCTAPCGASSCASAGACACARGVPVVTVRACLCVCLDVPVHVAVCVRLRW